MSGEAHIREYTMNELREYGEAAGLKAIREEYCSYWPQPIHIENIETLENENPSYRTGLTIIYSQ